MKKIIILLLAFTGVSYAVNAQTNTDSITFDKVEMEASFPGGQAGWSKYLSENLRADIPVKKKAKPGTYLVIVRFIVAKDGSISDVSAETNHGHGMEKEVIRVIKKGPKWIPAIQNGKPVNAYRKQPVTFVITEE